MNFPTQIGLPQLVLFIVALIGVGLLVSSLMSLRTRREVEILEDDQGHRYRRYGRHRRFRWYNAMTGIVLLLVAVLLLGIAGAVQEYIGLTGKILVAHVRAVQLTQPTPDSLPVMSVELTLYDQNGNASSPKTYPVNGDEVFMGGDIIAFPGWMNILGFHSGYKLTKLEGMYSDTNLEEHSPHTVVVLNGGDDAFFNTAYHKGWNSFFVTAAYKNGSTVSANSIGFNICASQDALVAQPDNESC